MFTVEASRGRKVNDTLTAVEADLKAACVTAIARINEVLAADPYADTQALHRQAQRLHEICGDIDNNRARREQFPDGLPTRRI